MYLIRLPILLLLVLGLCSCERPPALAHTEGVIMGTSYRVSWLPTEEQQHPEALQVLRERIFDVLDRVDQTMSTWKDDSELSRFNKADPEVWHTLSPELLQLLLLAHEINRDSGGAFDVTVGPLVNLWGFGPGGEPVKVPEPEEIEQLKSTLGHDFLELDNEQKRALKRNPLYIDLSAIAKGFAVDEVARYLEELGIRSYLVEVGGEIRLRGRKPDGEEWRVAIEAPEGSRSIYGILSASQLAMATSGDYRNFFEDSEQRYSHMIDPRSGFPVRHSLASATVVAETTAEADAWATAMMVLGPDEGRALAEARQLAVYFIIRREDGFEDWASEAFEQKVGPMERLE